MRCGIDLVHIPTLALTLKSMAVMKQFFHAAELDNTQPEHLAGVLAAKEAFFKALGVVPKFQDIQVAYEPSGRPTLLVAPQWQTFASCDVSISHDQDYATAVVLLDI